MTFEAVPGRVFLDTSVVNFMLDYGEQIHDGVAVPDSTSGRVKDDIAALHNIFVTGQRANWQLMISPYTYYEVAQTQDLNRRHQLETWVSEIWWFSEEVRRRISCDAHPPDQLRRSGVLDCLPDKADRLLILDAVSYCCDLFCTRDWTTILKHRRRLVGIPVEIVTPSEWWAQLRPYARLN